MHLTNWNARRAGPAITVTGTDQDGKPAKIVGITVISPSYAGAGYVNALGKNGEVHELKVPV